MYIYLYFNSWGGSDEQTKYVSDSLLSSTLLFKTFTVSITNYGGFDPTAIPDNSFRSYIIDLTKQLLTQMRKDIQDISRNHPDIPIVCISHSFGYNVLFACLKKLTINIHKIILLDPAGKALTKNQLIKDSLSFKKFIQLFKQPLTINNNRYLEWNTYISDNTDGLYTPQEKNTGMYRYISDCMNANPLDLSILGYGGDYWNIDASIQKYANKTYLLTTTNGIAYKKKSYWVKHIPSKHFLVIGDSGHFLHIYNQYNTLWFLCKIIGIKMNFIRYNDEYNAPLTNRSPT